MRKIWPAWFAAACLACAFWCMADVVDGGTARAQVGQIATVPNKQPPPAGGGGPTTLNPSDKAASVTLSGSNLIMTNSAIGAARSVGSYSSGKCYFSGAPSVTTGSFDHFIGIANGSASLTSDPATDANIAGLYNGYDHAYVATVDAGANGITYQVFLSDVLGVAVDFTAKLMWFRVESAPSTWSNGGDPAAGTNGISFSSITGPYYFYGQSVSNTAVNTFNFGPTFGAAAPSGFGAC